MMANGGMLLRPPELKWSPAMSVGVMMLDADHEALIRIINLVTRIKADGSDSRSLDSVLEALAAYGRYHFAREEKVMEACGFPGCDIHREEHAFFAQEVDSMRQRYAEDRDEELTDEVSGFLTAWLRHHILIQDMAYKPFVIGHKRAEEVARAAGPPLPRIVA